MATMYMQSGILKPNVVINLSGQTQDGLLSSVKRVNHIFLTSESWAKKQSCRTQIVAVKSVSGEKKQVTTINKNIDFGSVSSSNGSLTPTSILPPQRKTKIVCTIQPHQMCQTPIIITRIWNECGTLEHVPWRPCITSENC
ncbi:hypothetical protein Leryth_010553 [Lithospermum erythrorhizon]|nr:hypothetical protein Leryth_010553 [Lithospermum erythrorhizon]